MSITQVFADSGLMTINPDGLPVPSARTDPRAEWRRCQSTTKTVRQFAWSTCRMVQTIQRLLHTYRGAQCALPQAQVGSGLHPRVRDHGSDRVSPVTHLDSQCSADLVTVSRVAQYLSLIRQRCATGPIWPSCRGGASLANHWECSDPPRQSSYSAMTVSHLRSRQAETDSVRS